MTMFETFEEKELNFYNTVPMSQPFDYAMLLRPLPVGADVLTAEGSVRYFAHPMTPSRIKQAMPDLKYVLPRLR